MEQQRVFSHEKTRLFRMNPLVLVQQLGDIAIIISEGRREEASRKGDGYFAGRLTGARLYPHCAAYITGDCRHLVR